MITFLKEDLKISPKNKHLYITAVTHSSFNNKKNYEKLEFLGDSILNTIVSEHLYIKENNKNEGFFSKKRSSIVQRKNLNKIGKKIIPKKVIRHKLHTISENIYGNILEAIIGAIHIDLGYKKCKEFVKTNILIKEKKYNKEQNYKSKLLEWSQKNNKKIEFIKQQKGPDHKKEHFVKLYIGGKEISEAWGRTIKSAEQKTSQIAYNIVN